MLNNNEEEDDRIPDFAGNYGAFFDDTAMGEPEEDAEGHDVEDDLGQMLREAEEVCETEKESRDLKRMLEDYKYYCAQIVNKAKRSWVPHWNCCNRRHQMVCLIRDSRSC